jgi:hypothetical protein
VIFHSVKLLDRIVVGMESVDNVVLHLAEKHEIPEGPMLVVCHRRGVPRRPGVRAADVRDLNIGYRFAFYEYGDGSRAGREVAGCS